MWHLSSQCRIQRDAYEMFDFTILDNTNKFDNITSYVRLYKVLGSYVQRWILIDHLMDP